MRNFLILLLFAALLPAACSPRRAEVIGRFRPRGGIAINVKATYGEKIDE